MIQFPKPLDWFQRKLWRLYWIEWIIVFYLFMLKDQLIYHNIGLSDFAVAPLSALMMVFIGKYLVKFLFGITLFMSSIVGAKGFFHTVIDLLESLIWIIIDINYRLISGFSEEKLSIDPADNYMTKMGWK